MKCAPVWLVLVLVTCGSEKTRSPSQDQRGETQVPGTREEPPPLTDDDISVISTLAGEWDVPGEEARRHRRALERLNQIAPGWEETYRSARRAEWGECNTLKRFSGQQRGAQGAATPDEAETDRAESVCSRLEEQRRAHLKVLLKQHPERPDVHVLVAAVEVLEGDMSDLADAVERFPDDPQVWFWYSKLATSSAQRLRGAHTCLQLRRNYPGCHESYRAAANDYGGSGCSAEYFRSALHGFRALEQRGDGFSRDVAIKGKTYYREDAPLLQGADFEAVWHERNVMGGDYLSLELSNGARDRLLQATQEAGWFLVIENSDQALEAVFVAEPSSEAFVSSFSDEELLRGKARDGSDPERLHSLCASIFKREIPSELTWSRDDNKK